MKKKEKMKWKIKEESMAGVHRSIQFAHSFQVMIVTWWFKTLKQLRFLSTTCVQLWIANVQSPLRNRKQKMQAYLAQWSDEMVGAMEKGVKAAEIQKPPAGTFDGLALGALPQYVCFKAANRVARLTERYVLGIIVVLFLAYFTTSEVKESWLYKKWREKEYLLVPKNIPAMLVAKPQVVPDSYVIGEALHYLKLLGNVDALTVEEQYKTLAKFMAPSLRAKFWAEVQGWIETVREENLLEAVKVRNREIVSDEKGNYKTTALTRRERYMDSEFMGHTDEMVTMELKLMPPQNGREWFLEIQSLKREPVKKHVRFSGAIGASKGGK